MLWIHKNITAHIWPNDHYPPHVTFVSKDGWTARVKFSMVDDDFVDLWDIKLKRNVKDPGLNLINELASQLLQKLDSHCRPEWWRTQQTVCLDNKDVKRLGIPKSKRVELCDQANSQGRLIPKSGQYAQNKKNDWAVKASVKWDDGTITHDEKVEA